jgi:YggT family protein
MAILSVLALLVYFVRTIVLAVVVLLAIVFLLDWLVRTRRINPFHPVARAIRRIADPLVAPVERRILRAGGTPASAPIWALVGAVLAGIVLVAGLDFLVSSLAGLIFAATAGPMGLLSVIIRLVFNILELAIIIVVLISWLPISPFSPWVRWAFTITAPILRPLREIVPSIGMFDITPIVAYFLLRFVEWGLLRVIGM